MASSTLQHPNRSAVSLISRGPRTVGFPTPGQVRDAISDLVLENDLEQAWLLASEGVAVYPEDEGVLAVAGRLAVECDDTRRAAWLMEQLISIRRATALAQVSPPHAALPRSEGKHAPAPRQALAMRAE